MLSVLELLAVALVAAGIIINTANAQCEGCAKIGDKNPDLCFKHPSIANQCVSFYENPSKILFKVQSGKTVEFTTPPANTTENLIALIKMQEKQLSSLDAVLLKLSLDAWFSPERVIENKKKAMGLTFTASGLGYKIVQQGTGKKPEVGKKVKVHYRGTLFPDGQPFDNSYDRGEPIEFPLGTGRVIKGWDEGIQLFPVGSKGVLVIPPAIGYGSNAMGPIPANSTLQFEIEVVSAE
jgi:FKBP-type peptidyl-prolyl cis-trans isomerase